MPALTGLGALQVAEGQGEPALRTLTRALELDPGPMKPASTSAARWSSRATAPPREPSTSDWNETRQCSLLSARPLESA